MKKTHQRQPKATRAALPRPKPEYAESFSQFVVRDTDTLQTALLAIDINLHRSVVVTNAENVVVGVLSDGDARKSLLDGRLLSTPVHRIMNADFIAVGPQETDKAKDLLTARHIFVIPVIDSDGKLIGVNTST